MSGADQQWFPIAEVFPAGLDTETDPTRLKDGFTPDAYGLGIDEVGVLYKASAPSGSTQVKKTYLGNTWTWYFRRLWRINSTTLEYNAPLYQDVILYQDVDGLTFLEDANALLTFFPFAGSSMFVAKSTGGYQIPNAISLAGDFLHGDIEEAMAISNAANAIELDGVAYASNSHGLMAWNGTEVAEVTERVRDSVATYFANRALTIDRQKRRVIGTSAFVWDAALKKLFVYSGSNFRYTTRTIRQPDWAPFPVYRVAFDIENTSETDQDLTIQVRRDEDWEDPVDISIEYTEDVRARVEYAFEETPAAREFSLRITDMPTGIRIRQIDMLSELTSDPRTWSQ